MGSHFIENLLYRPTGSGNQFQSRKECKQHVAFDCYWISMAQPETGILFSNSSVRKY